MEGTVARQCASCGNEITAGQQVLLRNKNKKAPKIAICPNCANDMETTFKAETEDPNLAGAIALGIGAAIISSVIWYAVVLTTNYQLGIIAVALGWLVAQAVVIGAGRKRGPIVQAIAVILTAIGMLGSEYLIDHHFVVQALATEGFENVPIPLPVGLMLRAVVDTLKEGPITLLFYVFAIYQAFVIPGQRKLLKA